MCIKVNKHILCMWQHMTWVLCPVLWGIGTVGECTICMCMPLTLYIVLFCDCYLQSHTPAPSHFPLSLPPFHSPTPTAPHIPLLPLAKQWSVTLSIQYKSPHRKAISAPHGLHYFFCWMSPTSGVMTRTKCVVSICTKQKEYGHGWLNWNSTSHTHIITNKQWTLQIHKFSAKHMQVSVHLLFWQHHQRE